MHKYKLLVEVSRWDKCLEDALFSVEEILKLHLVDYKLIGVEEVE